MELGLKDRVAIVTGSSQGIGKAIALGLALEGARVITLRRLAQPKEIANLVVFLASERASYITGAVIQVDGGLIKGLL